MEQMKIKSDESEERSALPKNYMKWFEGTMSAVLSLTLVGIALAALYFTFQKMFTTHPFFPDGMIQSINNILFIVIILEIIRTVISVFNDGFNQLDKFLIIGVISCVRRILTTGASLTFNEKSSTHTYQTLWELGIDAVIAVLLVVALFVVQAAEARKQSI